VVAFRPSCLWGARTQEPEDCQLAAALLVRQQDPHLNVKVSFLKSQMLFFND